jgi:hypothetical protein
LPAVEEKGSTEFLAECFWPGVQESDLAALDRRADTTAVALSGQGEDVRYLGSLLMLDDEVVLCCFEGSEDSVRRAAEDAAIPFERIVKATRSRWNSPPTN